MNKRSVILWSVALSVLSLSAIAIFVSVLSPATGSAKASLAVAVSTEDNQHGSLNSNITVVVYSDFQCGACAELNESMKTLEATYGDRVKFVYRHFPLPQHKNSPLAAFAAEAAAKQGKFFELKDKIFSTQQVWGESDIAQQHFAKLAGELGLNVERFNSDCKSQAVMDKVVEDLYGAVQSKVQFTPAVFVNGRLLGSSVTEQTIRKQLDETLQNR